MPKLFALLSAAIFSVFLLSTVPAYAHHHPSTYCSPTGDFCQGTYKNQYGVRRLDFRTFSFRGRIKVCVTNPIGHRKCVRDRLHDGNNDGVYVSNLKWASRFPHHRKGAYTVMWKQAGTRIGKKIGFHRR